MVGTIRIIKQDITKMQTDAIVNAANESLSQGGGVCGAIFHAAGSRELNKACHEIGYCRTGKAVITPGFKLDAKYIIHAVGPQWHGGHENEEKLLYSCYQTSLILALDNNCRSIAFPLISAGIYNYPPEQAWETALHSCHDFLIKHDHYNIDIYFCVISDDMLELGRKVFADINGGYEAEEKVYKKRDSSEKVILFHAPDEKPYGCFSNWYPCHFTVEGIEYSSSEQYMMAKKALLFHDLEQYGFIMNTDDPALCQKAGQKVRGYHADQWEAVRWSVVHHAVQAKFRQNKNLKKILLETGDAVLGEAAYSDNIWGIGMHEYDDGATDPERWPGQNLLGRILMKVRAEIHND